MIFGKSNEQRAAAVRRREHWHLWFAWRIVRLGTGRLVWLEKVQRKGTWGDGYDGGQWDYEYAENKLV